MRERLSQIEPECSHNIVDLIGKIAPTVVSRGSRMSDGTALIADTERLGACAHARASVWWREGIHPGRVTLSSRFPA